VLTTLLIPALFGGAPSSRAQTAASPEIGIVEKLGETIPLDVELYDESGNVVRLQNVINKPTIVTFVYFRCPGICSPLLTELSKMVEKLDLELGKDYQILTLSFDSGEKPELAADKKENYLSSIPKALNPDGWHFFTGDSANIRRFTDAAGFHFKRDGKDWIHAAGLIFLSPNGKITRYINGIQYLPFDIKMAVIEASNGKVRPTIAQILRFCYSYDPDSRSYALNVTRISLAVIIFLAAVFAAVFLVRPRQKNVEKGVGYGKTS
jgi:protein SCO1